MWPYQWRLARGHSSLPGIAKLAPNSIPHELRILEIQLFLKVNIILLCQFAILRSRSTAKHSAHTICSAKISSKIPLPWDSPAISPAPGRPDPTPSRHPNRRPPRSLRALGTRRNRAAGRLLETDDRLPRFLPAAAEWRKHRPSRPHGPTCSWAQPIHVREKVRRHRENSAFVGTWCGGTRSGSAQTTA
jgi:hypothetical protein